MKALAAAAAAKYAGVSRTSLARWVRQGLLPKCRDPLGHPVYRLADLQRVIIQRPKRGRPFPRSRV